MEASKVVREVSVTNREGFHLRAATVLMNTARSFGADIVIIKGGMSVDAKSTPLQLLGLGAFQGDLLVLEAIGNDAQEAVDALHSLFERHFEEEEGSRFHNISDPESLKETR